MKISFITTIFNEQKTIETFLDSLFSQTHLPNEIIIVDGMSTDGTVDKINKYKLKIKKKKIKFTILVKKGNRSVGRNEAIKHATGEIIVCSDAGNILDKNWIRNIIKPFKDTSVDVVAGYYKGQAKNIFQKCLIPYVLVMPDKVDPDTFLPATRSIAFTKKIWKKMGGFDECFSHNEDYVFANKLKEKRAKIVFAKDAIVYWIPRNTYKEAFIMFFRFALGDAEAKIWRTNVLLLFARYFLGFYFIFLSLLYRSLAPFIIILLGIIVYLIWSVKKNYKYIKDKRAYRILPLLQFTTDAAVLLGTLSGVAKLIRGFKYYIFLKQNKFLTFVLSVYLLIMFATLQWGIPNQYHPFPYHMDEWHQLQAVANTFRYGTPNVFGSANGTMFHFLLSGIYLLPFMAAQIINPFELQLENSFMRERVFEILRTNTILWGVLSIFVLYKIAEMIKAPKRLTIILFTFTPIWLMLSGHFKYDIALIFWILLSMLFLLNYVKNPTNKNFIISAIPVALATAVKVSAIPLLCIYVFSYFFFHLSRLRNIKYFLIGLGTFFSIVVLFGLPDTVFGKGNILLYLFENIIQGPVATSNFQLGINSYLYLFAFHFPLIFGHSMIILFLISIIFWIFQVYKKGIKHIFIEKKVELFLLFALLVFLFSILPLQIFATGNRSLVLLPFIVLFITLQIKDVIKLNNLKKVTMILVAIVVFAQIYESLAWIYVKTAKSPQVISSDWIRENLPRGAIIGIENIPIYQQLPDLVQKEYYFNQYNIKQENLYKYLIVDYKTPSLPKIIILTNADINYKVFRESSQKELVKRLKKEGYTQKIIFVPDLKYTNPFTTDMDYYFSGLTTFPLTITVFEK